MDHPLPRLPPPPSWLPPPSLPSPTLTRPLPGPGGAAGRKPGAAAPRPFVAQIKGPERHKGGPHSGRAATHSRTCSSAKCHCRFCGASAGDAPPRRQMTVITLDGN